ncbi:hypothetical protein TWF102_002956 [Orbilia oligospora]|uniref:Uncharacterized protein n=2 Tax=Orbilia oligospora TaxID=2813651 RepID=A0A7C8MYA7_ORBOL|nr:hypothetical protein TWF102_002956 [Orbilia oligospora]
MPFDFQKYDAKCAAMTPAELQLQWEHYTRLISGAATSTAVSGVALPLTMGVSVVGVALAAPAIHNARKKREIIEKHLNSHGTSHVTRKRDVLTSVAISGTVGVVTMGASTLAADAVTSHAANYGIQQVVENELAVKVGTHVAFDAAAMAGEHAHTEHKRKKEAQKAEQQGLVAPILGPQVSFGQEVPPDGFYPVVPIPQGHSNVQSSESVAAPSGSSYSYPGPVVLQEIPPPPPQYPGSPLDGSSYQPFVVEKKDIISGPPSTSTSGSDSKYKLVVVEQHDTQAPAPPLYAPPPAGAIPVMEKMGEPQVYSAPQSYPQQHYPPPSVQSSNISSYPSYPGTMMNYEQPGPFSRENSGPVASNSNQVLSQPSHGRPVQQIAGHPHQDSSSLPIYQNPSTAPPQTISNPSYAHQGPNQPRSHETNFQRPPLQHQRSYSTPTHPPTYPYQSYAPPPPQSYQLNGTHSQHPTFPPNSFPPPPPPSNYPLTPAQTPGASYPQYIPAQHAPPSAYPTGYPTPVPTPYSEYMNPMVPRQYLPEKQAFPQYQEVPIPGPQILSQQGQYLEQQAAVQRQYQYPPQPSGYHPQHNIYQQYDRQEYWQKPLSLRQFGKLPPPMTSTEECRMVARNKAKAQLDAVTIWNRQYQNVQTRAVAFYAHIDCNRRSLDAKVRAGVGPLPLLIIVLDPNQLGGLHIAALSQVGIFINPVAFQAFDIETAISPKGGPADGLILAKIKEFELLGLGPYLGYRGDLDLGTVATNQPLVSERLTGDLDLENTPPDVGRVPETMLLPDELEQDAKLFDLNFGSPLVSDLLRINNQALDPSRARVMSASGEADSLLDFPDTILQDALYEQNLPNAPASENDIILEAFENAFCSKFALDEAETTLEGPLLRRLLPTYDTSFDKGKWLAGVVTTAGSIMNKIIQAAMKIYNTNGNLANNSRNSRDSGVKTSPQLPCSQTMRLDDILLDGTLKIEGFEVSVADSLGSYDPSVLELLRDVDYNHNVDDL